VYGNLNAPPAVAYSAIIYSLRCLVTRDIPLNQGCLAPIKVRQRGLPTASSCHTVRWAARVDFPTLLSRLESQARQMHLVGLTTRLCTLCAVQVVIPEQCLLNPSPQAAVVGGNVLTSQRVTDVVLKAFGAAAASQVRTEGCRFSFKFKMEKAAGFQHAEVQKCRRWCRLLLCLRVTHNSI